MDKFVLFRKRAFPRQGIFVTTFAVVFFLAALCIVLSGYLAASATTGARAGLNSLTGASGAFRITIPLAANSPAQDARVEREIRSSIHANGHPVPVKILSDIETPAAVELDGTRGVVRAALASVPHLAARANIVMGHWPNSSAEASVQADAAEALGVRVGDVYKLPGGSSVTVVGTWRVRNAADPAWLGDGLFISGLGEAGLPGFVVIDPSLWSTVRSAPEARWTIIPDSHAILSSQLTALMAAPDAAPSALLADARNGTSVDQDGRLQPALVPIIGNVLAATAVSITPLVIVGVLGIVTLIELARMLTQLRSVETELLRARGATQRRMAIWSAIECSVLALPAATLGAVSGAVSSQLITQSSPLTMTGWVAAAAVAATAIAVFAISAALAFPSDAPQAADRIRRTRGAFGIAVVSLTILAAVVAVTQFLQYGSPLTVTSSGALGVDPLAVTAPALALAALSLLGLGLFPIVSHAAERVARGSIGLGSLPIQQLARRNRAATTPVLLITLAIGGLLFAATYSGTWETSSAQMREVQVGSDLRITGSSALTASETKPVPGQLAAAPATTGDVQIGNDLVPIVELPRARMRSVITPVHGAVDPRALAQFLSNSVATPTLPRATRAVVLSFIATPSRATPTQADVTVVDATGTLTTINGTAENSGLVMPLPSGVAPWTVHAVDLTMPAVHQGDRVTIVLRTSGTGHVVELGKTWVISDEGIGHPGFEMVPGPQPSVKATATGDGLRIRLQPRPNHGSRLPLVVSTALANSNGLHVGSQIDIGLVNSGGALPAVVRGVVPVVPGLVVDSGVMADLGAVQDEVLREGLHNVAPSEWWISTSSPTSASHWLAHRVPVGAVIETNRSSPGDTVLNSANVVVWIAGAATAGLAMLAVAAFLLAELRVRLSEVALLRALGVGRRPQARGRAIEIGALLVLGVIAGLIDGLIVSALIVPDLARTAVPNALAALPTVIAFNWGAGTVSLLAVVVTAAVLLTATSFAVRRQSSLASSARDSR